MAFTAPAPLRLKTALGGMLPTSASDAELKAGGWLRIGMGVDEGQAPQSLGPGSFHACRSV